MNEFENDQAIDDQIVEITDLDPIESPSRFSRIFEILEKRPSFRQRFLRLTLVSCSVLLIALVLFSTFPSVRGLASNLLARVKPAKETALVTPRRSGVHFT